MNDTLRQVLIVVAVLATIAVNGLANALPLNGLTTGQISDGFDTLFVPAGYVFAIWGLIYLGLLVYAAYQALPSQRDDSRLKSMAVPLLIASVANMSWIFLWHYQVFTLTIVAMVTLLLALITIYLRLRRGTATVSLGERWLVRLPFSVYLGWVSVATIANAQDVLYSLHWNGFGLSDETWAAIMLIVGLALAGVMAWRRRDPAFVLVFVWAYAGIGVAQADTPIVSLLAYALAGVLTLIAVAAAWPGARGTAPRRAP